MQAIAADPDLFLSTPSARRATPAFCQRLRWYFISIHALREEGDVIACRAKRTVDIFLSTPSARRATYFSPIPFDMILFLSTPSARRATEIYTQGTTEDDDFYPRPPRGGRPIGDYFGLPTNVFLSTPSARRATSVSCMLSVDVLHFYPRPPRGGRQQKQRENPLLLSHYTPPCTNCKEVPVKQTAKSHRYLRKRLVFRCEASGKTMCAACSHWRGIKRSAHYPAQTPGAAQHARP